jgi:hypothetical protein
MLKGVLKICKKGHRFYKSSDCPTCPICEAERKPTSGFLSLLSAPAVRALEGAGLTTLTKVSKISEKKILELHGVGPGIIKILKRSLKAEALEFKKD